MTRAPGHGSRDAPEPPLHRGLRAAWIVVILTALPACDNVEWGGVSWQLRSPPATDTSGVADSVGGETGPTLPEGDVLFVVRQPPPAEEGQEPPPATLYPVAEISGDSLRPLSFDDDQFRALFVREMLGADREFALFAGGRRVGTFAAGEENVTRADDCAPRPGVQGIVELSPGAAGVREFLALEREAASGFTRSSYRRLESNLAQRNATVNIAGEVIPQVGAQWPTSLPVARRDLQILSMEPGGIAVASTFLFRDQMAVAEPSDGTYALFILAEEQAGTDTGYGSSFVWYREARRDGKGVPRVFGQLDWDGDGQSEILLEVLGARSRWFAALDRPGGEWERIYQDPCGTAERQAPSPPPGG